MMFKGVQKRAGAVVREGFLNWELLAGRACEFHLHIPISSLFPEIQQVLN